MKFTLVCTVLALAFSANMLSISGYKLQGPIFGIAQSQPQPQVSLEKEVQILAEKSPIVENHSAPVELKSETQNEREEPVALIDPELVHEPINMEPEAELEKPNIAVEPSFLDKAPQPNILDPYRRL